MRACRMVDVLIAHGADVNAKNKNGETPLDATKQGGHNEIVKLLQQHATK